MKSPSQSTGTKTKEKIIEEQIQRWQRDRERRLKKEIPRPIITISRQMGSGGEELARRIAAELNLDFFDREIISAVAESVRMSEKVVSTLDERMRSSLENWIQILKTTRYLWPDKYRSHLTKVVGTIAAHGNAVIFGRGAHHLLPPDEVLRIRFVAPLKHRIETIARNERISPAEAEHLITQTEADRKAYIEQHFHVDINDPGYYDFIINTEHVKAETIVEIIRLSLKYRKTPTRRRFDDTSGEEDE